MRIAVGIIGLILPIIILFQSCAAGVGGALAKDSSMSGGASFGFLVALLYIFGGAFAFQKPKVSKIIFIITGCLAIIGGMGSKFSDLIVWGVVALGLAAGSHSAEKTLRKQSQNMNVSSQAIVQANVYCRKCGTPSNYVTGYCKNCGEFIG